MACCRTTRGTASWHRSRSGRLTRRWGRNDLGRAGAWGRVPQGEKMRGRVLGCVAAVTLAAPAAGLAQGRGGPVWTTSGGDAERTASMRTDPRISLESMQQPGFTLAWKRTLDNAPRQLESLTAPVMSASGFITYKGFKAVAYVGGSADNVYAVDYDLNRM